MHDILLNILLISSAQVEKVVEKFNLGKYFGQNIISPSGALKPKPDPSMILKIMERMSLQPDETLFVGDNPSDYQSSIAAGVKFVGYKYETPGSLSVKSHAELLPLIRPDGRDRPLIGSQKA